MGNHKLKKHQFQAIRNELLDTTRNRTQADIAADYQVSSSMVSLVNNVRSWGNYLTGTKAKTPLRGSVSQTQPTQTKSEQAQQAGLNPVSIDQRIEQRFAEELETLNKKYASRSELEEAAARLQTNIDGTNRRVNKKLDAPTKEEARIDTAFTWAISAITLVALVLAIIK